MKIRFLTPAQWEVDDAVQWVIPLVNDVLHLLTVPEGLF
jgi:hypothetical protein